MEITKAQAAEAVKLFGMQDGWIDEVHSITNISRSFFDKHLDMFHDGSRQFYDACLLACIFNAGRVQGIRDERARRNRTNKDGDKA